MYTSVRTNEAKLIEGPIYKFMLNCPLARCTVEFDNAAPYVVNGKQTFLCPHGIPWKRIIITALNAPTLIGVWYTNNEYENLPIVEPAITSLGAAFSSVIAWNGGSQFAIQVLGALGAITTLWDYTATTPMPQTKSMIQNLGPADIIVVISNLVAKAQGIVVPANGGIITTNYPRAFAYTSDDSNQVTPADTRILQEGI